MGELIHLRFVDTLDDDLKSFTGDWTCSKCGLTHQHHPRIHDLRELDFLTAGFIRQLDWNEQCNCGLVEAAYAAEHNADGIADSRRDDLARLKQMIAVPRNVETQIQAKSW